LLTEEINTSTPGGKLIFHIFAALAEFEHGLIIERTRAGMKTARARGVRSGPKPKLSRQQIEPKNLI
jgi:DNA invertase Pin-like site-specific DNA recombinase